MFYGSIPGEAQSISSSIIKTWDVTDVYVGCSGNFTIEKFVAPLERFTLHSNDVTLYSRCLGQYLSGQPVELEQSEVGAEKFPWMADYLKSDLDKIATVMLATRVVAFADKDHKYYQKMYSEYVKQWPKLHQKTSDTISRNTLRVADYYNGDVMDFIDSAPEDIGFMAYPPFKNAGAAFVKDFARLEEVFVFEPPPYEFFNEELLLKFFEHMMEKKCWMFGTDMRLPGDKFARHLKGMTKTTNRGMPIYIYGNTGKVQIVSPRQETETFLIEKLMPGDEVGDKISLKILSNNAFQTLRSQYMNINIRPGSATLALAVMVDDKLVGVYAFSAAPSFADWSKHIDTPSMYLLSDFPVEPVDYDRLAKLVLLAALSKESKLIAERVTRRRVRSLVTTAFSKNPVSMKYRGLFKLLTRKHNDSYDQDWAKGIDPANAYYNQPYELNYGAPMGQWTLDEALEIWKKKHSQKSGKKVGD